MPTIEFNLEPLTGEHGLALAVTGMLVVFLALALVVTFITVLPRIASWLSRAHPSPAPAMPVEDEQLPEELLVVIAAAVAEVVRHPHRIVHIRTPGDMSWSLEARLQHHQSHKIPHRDR
ncbi:MAG: sodium ion-translocating decarboxylase [Planctomycetota bacterium]|nr:MAG: sodium ion-translocating decarboxylase [Planctomycetota bacterium]REJ88563.1 MAG: sodium ion-translocating decarboxylase [Planctomycetota bacterium]REK22445.1 MAG: sodium ion-translocating decarboxylase [Planctomycetota bacterium]REK34905.1 MAG: sodium ion-translocating decarboxylase [Planctomycetota bacterium]